MGVTQFTERAVAPRTVDFYLSVKGKNSGVIEGEVTRGKIGAKQIAVYQWHWETTTSRDQQTGLASGKRQHTPLICQIPLGKYSPLLAQALWTNETLTEVVLDFVRANDQGENFLFYSIKLTNAALAWIKDSSGPAEGYPMEEIAFVYQKIEIEYKDGGVLAMDEWQAAHR